MARNILKKKIGLKRSNAAKEGLQYLLSDEELCWLLTDAGITPEDWTLRGYHLARYNDSGNYQFNNCRFIPYLENFRERKTTDSQREFARKRFIEINRQRSPEEYHRIALLGGMASTTAGLNKLTEQDLYEKYKRVEHLDASRWGFAVKTAPILGISEVHVRRLKRRWKELGFF